MNRESALQILLGSMHSNSEIRASAEKSIQSLVRHNFADFLSSFIQIVFDQAVLPAQRLVASAILKKYLHSRVTKVQKTYEAAWMALPRQFRADFISFVHRNLNIRENSLFINVCTIYGSITRIETVNRTDIHVFKLMRNDISNLECAAGILNALALACDQLYDETSYAFEYGIDDIYYMTTYYLNTPVGIEKRIVQAALHCISCTLEIYEDLLESNGERFSFITRIFNLLGEDDDELLSDGLDVFNRIIFVYSTLSSEEMSYICLANLNLFQKHIQNPPFQLFEFWTLLIEFEKFSIISHHIQPLSKILLQLLKPEEFDLTTSTSSKSACSLLLELVTVARFHLLNNPSCEAFVSNCLQSQDRTTNATGCLALGCIFAAGAESFMYQIMQRLIELLDYPETANEALFAFTKICAGDLSLTADYLSTIIQKAKVHLQQKTTVGLHSIMFFNSVFSSVQNDVTNSAANILYANYVEIFSILIQRLGSCAFEEHDMRSFINATLAVLIETCPPIHNNLIDHLEHYITERLEHSIIKLKSGTETTVLQTDDIMCSYVILLVNCLTKKKVFDVNKILDLFYRCLYLPKMLLRGEIYIAISKLISSFSVYLKKFVPLIIRDLKCDETFVFKSALNLLSDSAIYLETNFIEFTSLVIPELVNAIISSELPFEVKPRIIEAIGDIALSIGAAFEPYISLSVLLLSQVNTLDHDGEYSYELKRAIIQLFTCLFVAVKDTTEMNTLLGKMLDGLAVTIQTDKEGVYIKESLQLISDGMRCYPNAFAEQKWIEGYLSQVIRNSTQENKKYALDLYQLIK